MGRVYSLLSFRKELEDNSEILRLEVRMLSKKTIDLKETNGSSREKIKTKKKMEQVPLIRFSTIREGENKVPDGREIRGEWVHQAS